jgi:hypothetical protein
LRKVDKIVFCTFLEKEKICYRELLPVYFPVPPRPVAPIEEVKPVEERMVIVEKKGEEEEPKPMEEQQHETKPMEQEK